MAWSVVDENWAGKMVAFPQPSLFAGLPAFSGEDVLRGTTARPEQKGQDGRLWVDVEGVADSLCFYGLERREDTRPPLIYLEGDCSRRDKGRWAVYDSYLAQSPFGLQLWAEQLALYMDRTFVTLARPGVYGSSGNHQQRRRPREVAVVDAALTALKDTFGWRRIDLVGFSGGGHLVAALMARRSDIDLAVIASGNVSVRQRNAEFAWQADVTGYADFVDPIDLVSDVASHPPRGVIALTDPLDTVVSAACQIAYVQALRRAGVPVDHRFVPALEPGHHALVMPALMAASGGGKMNPHVQNPLFMDE